MQLQIQLHLVLRVSHLPLICRCYVMVIVYRRSQSLGHRRAVAGGSRWAEGCMVYDWPEKKEKYPWKLLQT